METGRSPKVSAQLQLGFSEQYARTVFDRDSRRQKAKKVLSILADCLGDLTALTAIDIGCAAGYSTVWYGKAFKWVVGTDIDSKALKHARMHNGAENVAYVLMDGQRLAFADAVFDVAICAHVYEHVPNAHLLLAEIRRLLKPGGVCFFSAGNRIALIEPHYRLPFLSILPRPVANAYLRALNRGRYYYEKHMTYWQLRKLVQDFELLDYTKSVVDDPARFCAEDVVRPRSVLQRASQCMMKLMYWACPTYLWVLRKPLRG